MIFGLIGVIWPNDLAEFTWAVRHGIDDDGRKSVENSIRFFGIVMIVGAIIWFVKQLNS